MRVLIAVFVFFFISVPAHADWVEARTENFIFRGDVSEKKAKVIVGELEEYRATIFTLLGKKPVPELVPVTIYAVKSTKSVKDITGSAASGGVYATTREGPVFVINVKGSFSQKSQARSIAYHEYTHHLISTYTNHIYPRWFNEGYAEYLSTFKVTRKGVIHVGLPSNSRGQSLNQHGFMDMNILVNSVRNYPFRNNSKRGTNIARYRFYAHSWLAVHYIQSTEGYNSKLRAYLTALDQADVPENVFELSFGMTPEAFGDILKKYYKKNKFLTLAITLDKDLVFPEVTTRTLSKGEMRFHQGEAVRRFRSDEGGIETALEYYAESEETQGPMAQIEASRALMALKKKKNGEAIKHAEQAYSLSPKDSRILQVAGHVYLKTFKDTGSEEANSQITRARKFLKNAMRANPANMQAHYDYVSTFIAARDDANKQAIYSAGECAYYYRARHFISSNMSLAEVLYRNEKFDEARPLLERISVWGSSSGMRRFARGMLKDME